MAPSREDPGHETECKWVHDIPLREACREVCSVLKAIPFLIGITRLAHLPHLSDQAIGNFHLIVGLGKTFVQFSAPSQLYSISVFQFLKEKIHMKATRDAGEKSFHLCSWKQKLGLVNLTNSRSYHFASD